MEPSMSLQARLDEARHRAADRVDDSFARGADSNHIRLVLSDLVADILQAIYCQAVEPSAAPDEALLDRGDGSDGNVILNLHRE